ncbi:hypothetical protein F5Y18DRAFT_425384 [Xylariaceae sp. FL1019]|nr:hypothetical protein F5Y18DRAFT_425384 [Xylariaceae sp. FL1019]
MRKISPWLLTLVGQQAQCHVEDPVAAMAAEAAMSSARLCHEQCHEMIRPARGTRRRRLSRMISSSFSKGLPRLAAAIASCLQKLGASSGPVYRCTTAVSQPDTRDLGKLYSVHHKP